MVGVSAHIREERGKGRVRGGRPPNESHLSFSWAEAQTLSREEEEEEEEEETEEDQD